MGFDATAPEEFQGSVGRLRAALAQVPSGTDQLWPALSRLDWALRLPSEAAPGYVYLAGLCHGSPVGGGGADLYSAACRLAGEASETLAQLAPYHVCALAPEPKLAALWGAGPCVAATNLTRGQRVGVPAAAIYTDLPAPRGTPPRSLGLAAGSTLAAARTAAVLELIERDAAAAWWNGETRPRGVPLCQTAAVAASLAELRAGAVGPARCTALFALPSVTGLPVVCACSRDAGGRNLVFGLKAALDLASALDGAMIEMLQMEIALDLARLRSAQGRPAPEDAGPMARAALDPDAFEALAPRLPAGPPAPSAAGLGDLVAHLATRGLEVTVADLEGLRGGLRVAKAFVPGLRPLPGPGPAPLPGAPGDKVPLL